MHVLFLATGIQHDLEQFEKYMQTRTFPIEVEDKEGKKHIRYVQGALRPIKMFDFVFPRDSKDLVLNSLDLRDSITLTDNKGKKILGKTFNMLRKLLKLKKIPTSDKSKGAFPLYKDNIRLIGIGMKDDVDFINKSGFKQEAL